MVLREPVQELEHDAGVELHGAAEIRCDQQRPRLTLLRQIGQGREQLASRTSGAEKYAPLIEPFSTSRAHPPACPPFEDLPAHRAHRELQGPALFLGEA